MRSIEYMASNMLHQTWRQAYGQGPGHVPCVLQQGSAQKSLWTPQTPKEIQECARRCPPALPSIAAALDSELQLNYLFYNYGAPMIK